MRQGLDFIHHLCWHPPQTCILLIKLDLAKAYQRLHVGGFMAAASLTRVNGAIMMLTRLTFGLTMAPPSFYLVAQIF